MDLSLSKKCILLLNCLIVFAYGKLDLPDKNRGEHADPSVSAFGDTVLQQDVVSSCNSGINRNDCTVLSPGEQMAHHYRGILGSVGVDVSHGAVSKTPERAAKAMQYFTSGYNTTLAEIVNGAIFTETVDSIVVVKDIQMFSLCEHHLLPFMGKVTIGYQPRNTILGLSKFARIVDMFSRRLQVQERLTRQIAEAVVTILEPEGVGVIIEATHLCMVMRGVHQINSKTTTSYLLGSFKDDGQTRQEFLHAAGT